MWTTTAALAPHIAFKRGRLYGTILVDLEQHRPVDLLPDRETGTLSEWLRAHRRFASTSEAARCRSARRADPVRASGYPFHDYLERRWREGCHNATLLLGEIRSQGYPGGHTVVREFLLPMRARLPTISSPSSRRPAAAPRAHRLAWLATNREHPRARLEDVAFLDAVAAACPEVKGVMELAQKWCTMIRERRDAALDAWLSAARQSGIAEMQSLASGLLNDRAAVEAALSLSWSNGQVEGQVSRLKFLKRSMYGRASFDLLRARVLHRPAA